MVSKDLMKNIDYQWYKSINEIKQEDWVRVFGDSFIKSHSFFKAMEESNFPNVEYHYLVINKEGVTVSILPCFCYNLDLLYLITSKHIIYFIKKIRSILPNIFKLKTFVTGTYVATCEHFIEYSSKVDEKEVKILSEITKQQLKKRYKETNSQIILIKDIKERSINYVEKYLSDDFCFFVSFPTTVIPIFCEKALYPQILKKKNRKRYRNFKEKFDARFTWEIITDFKNYTQLFNHLYQNVLNKAPNKFDVLNENFFCKVNELFPNNSYILVAKDKQDKVRLIEIILEEKDRLLPLYLGIKYENDDTKILYLNAIFRTIEEAEKRGKDLVEFGQTSYYPKVMSGAMAENIYYGFWSDKLLLNKMIHKLFKRIFIPPHIMNNVYLEEYKNIVFRKLESKGFVLMNK